MLLCFQKSDSVAYSCPVSFVSYAIRVALSLSCFPLRFALTSPRRLPRPLICQQVSRVALIESSSIIGCRLSSRFSIWFISSCGRCRFVVASSFNVRNLGNNHISIAFELYFDWILIAFKSYLSFVVLTYIVPRFLFYFVQYWRIWSCQ